MEALISVIVPLYNYAHYIKDCVQSILNQTYKNFELIVIDDCSTDDSCKKIRKFEKDKRFKLIKLSKNYGYSKAKNEGVIASRGEYIVTLDADDMMLKNSLEVRLRAALKKNVSFVYADAIKIVGGIRLKQCYSVNSNKIKKMGRIPSFIYDPSHGIYNIHAQTIMIQRGIFKIYGLFDEKLRSRSDREMWWRLFGKDESYRSNVSNYYLDQPVAYYRAHPYSMWRKRKRNKKLDESIIKKSEKAYLMRKKDGITKNNTRFLER